jgi:uncharacterized protein YbjT (DUF2867 family)
MTFLLTGATGQVGSIVARNLLDRGHRVRALVRDPGAAAAKLGPDIEYVRGDLEDPATLPVALKGVEAAYLATAPSPAMTGQEGNFIDAAAEAKLPRLVKLGVIGTDLSVPIFKFHQDIEAKIAASGIPATVLRPSGFYSSFLFMAQMIQAGVLPSTAGDGGHPWIDHADVSGVATAVLLDGSPGHVGQVIEMTGPVALTNDDVAAALERALGHPVAHEWLDEQTLRAQLASFGLPDWLIDSLLGQQRLTRENRLSMVSSTVENVLGRPPRTFDQWLTDNKPAFAAGH